MFIHYHTVIYLIVFPEVTDIHLCLQHPSFSVSLLLLKLSYHRELHLSSCGAQLLFSFTDISFVSVAFTSSAKPTIIFRSHPLVIPFLHSALIVTQVQVLHPRWTPALCILLLVRTPSYLHPPHLSSTSAKEDKWSQLQLQPSHLLSHALQWLQAYMASARNPHIHPQHFPPVTLLCSTSLWTSPITMTTIIVFLFWKERYSHSTLFPTYSLSHKPSMSPS